VAALDQEPAARPRHTARWVAVALGVVLALLVYLLATRDPASTRLASSPLVGRPVPALAGESLLDGRPFDIGTQSGRWVLVNFFATWCVPCVSEHDDLQTFAAAHEGPGDARVVSVVFDDDPDDVTAFFEERGGDWPVLGNDGRVTVDFGVTGVPESFLVAPNGVVWGKIIGGVEASRLEAVLERAKAETGL
jgi:cytochrome c biogenesis protein CcmG/thiol:disulfide interchange protein DsbE